MQSLGDTSNGRHGDALTMARNRTQKVSATPQPRRHLITDALHNIQINKLCDVVITHTYVREQATVIRMVNPTSSTE
jgi:hypothetical protein